MLQLAVRVLLDVIEGRVDSRVGRTTFRFGKTDATGTIDGRSFTLSNTQARALQGLPRYRVYFFRALTPDVDTGVIGRLTSRGSCA